MTKTNITDLRKLDTKKLQEHLASLKEQLFQTKFEVKSGQSKNIHIVHNLKKEIAQTNTVLKEKELTK